MFTMCILLLEETLPPCYQRLFSWYLGKEPLLAGKNFMYMQLGEHEIDEIDLT